MRPIRRIEVELFFALLVTATVCLYALWPPGYEPRIRLCGLGLQLLGILTVAWGVSITRAEFGLPSFARTVGRYLGRVFHFRGRTQNVGVIGASMGTATGRARVVQTRTAAPDAPLEERLAAAEYNIGHLRKEIDAAYDRLDEETSARVAAVAQETEQRTVGDRQLADRLQAASTGGLHVPLIGALWLLTGVILSTSSPELEKWLNGKPIFQSSSVAN